MYIHEEDKIREAKNILELVELMKGGMKYVILSEEERSLLDALYATDRSIPYTQSSIHGIPIIKKEDCLVRRTDILQGNY